MIRDRTVTRRLFSTEADEVGISRRREKGVGRDSGEPQK